MEGALPRLGMQRAVAMLTALVAGDREMALDVLCETNDIDEIAEVAMGLALTLANMLQGVEPEVSARVLVELGRIAANAPERA